MSTQTKTLLELFKVNVSLSQTNRKAAPQFLACSDKTLSLSHSRSEGGGITPPPNPFQVAPEASRVGCEGVSWPGVPPGVIVGRILEHQMLDRLVGAVAV